MAGTHHPSDETDDNEWLTIEEVALALRRSEVTLRRWARAGTIPCVKLGPRWLVHRDVLVDLRVQAGVA